MKKQASTLGKIPNGCTPFPLPRPTEGLPEMQKELAVVHDLIARLYSPDEGPEPVADALGLFFAAAKGDLGVIKGLLDHAFTLITILRTIAENNPDVLRPLARKSLVWPDLIGIKEGSRDNNKWLLKHLQLGTECSMRGKWDPKSPATQTALSMLIWLTTNQRVLGLPNLTQETRKQWFETGWIALLNVTGNHPEKVAYLRRIGQHYGQHSKNTGAQKRVTLATRESNIRAGIKKQLWQSFQNLTQHVPKSTD